jgi:hypothetical protein
MIICEVNEILHPPEGRSKARNEPSGRGDSGLAAGHFAQPRPGNSQARFRPLNFSMHWTTKFPEEPPQRENSRSRARLGTTHLPQSHRPRR